MKRKTRTAPMTRTVKIGDEIHHQLRIISAVNGEPLQALIERILKAGIQREQIGAFSR